MNKKVILVALLALAFSCGGGKKEALSVVEAAPAEQMESVARAAEDTTIYQEDIVTAVLENAKTYFRTNNRYKDRDPKDPKMAVVRAVIEKDGTPAQLTILGKGTGEKELDTEALRLIQEATITPAKNGLGEPVRSLWTIAVHFPPK